MELNSFHKRFSFAIVMEPLAKRMSEHSQLANAMLVILFAAGMFVAAERFLGYQSTRVAASTTYVTLR
jgi:hypothetical protein